MATNDQEATREGADARPPRAAWVSAGLLAVAGATALFFAGRWSRAPAAVAPASTDCPVGYARVDGPPAVIVCRAGEDEVVRVGRGASAFWIDRYEASLWTEPLGRGSALSAATRDDWPLTFPPTGQWTVPVYAASRRDVMPSASLSWFQAAEACRAAGKRLPSGEEWLTAARGTPDPPMASAGSAGTCLTSGTAPRETGSGGACASAAGAEDMIGNLWEYTNEWFAGLGDGSPALNRAPAPAMLNADGTWNIASSAFVSQPGVPPSFQAGLPAVASRGGPWLDGPRAGIFALMVANAPTHGGVVYGFRCVVPRG